MGNSSSSGRGHHDESVDYGSLVPQGVYTGPRDWNQAIVSQAIVARRLAPYYRPLEDYEDSWDDDQILAARKELPDPDSADTVTRIEATATQHRSSKRPSSLKEPAKPEAQVYRGAVECPICFLYYPPNINHSRCCDQAICTECFVQIKRAEPTTTHLVSEPAACPYCVQDNFGVVYTPPPWRAGLGSEGHNGLFSDTHRSFEPSAPPTHKRRQKSFGAESPEVVTTDQIRPDWEAKLEAVRAAVARRANRRIIMRQVGDRLIPVGVTSGRVHALSPEEAAAVGAEGGGSRRSRRRQQAQGGGAFEQFMGMAGQDLEELMLMEAMRLSLIDHEEQQRKEAEEKKKQEAAAGLASGETGQRTAESSTSATPSPGPGPSALETQLSMAGSSMPSSSGSSINRSTSSQQPTHAKVNSQDSLSPGRSATSSQQPSRSVTPEPRTAASASAAGVPVTGAPVSSSGDAALSMNANASIPTITVINNEPSHETTPSDSFDVSPFADPPTHSSFSASGESHVDSEMNVVDSIASSTTFDSDTLGGATQSNSLLTLSTASGSTDVGDITSKGANANAHPPISTSVEEV